MLRRDDWLDLARKLDWDFSYVAEEDVYPAEVSGRPSLPAAAWSEWNEPFRTSFSEYVTAQDQKNAALAAVREALGSSEELGNLDPGWQSVVKLYAATLPLAEFDAVVGNLRAARFGRDSAWRMTATLGALDELRHTELPLVTLHDLVRTDPQYDFTHSFYHGNNWVAIAARHFADELLLASDPIEFAVGTNFVFETGFTNLQFVALSSLARKMHDRSFERMLTSIQTDEARHSQIGPAVLRVVAEHAPEYAQHLLDKWFWRSFLLFAVVTGFSMDYLTPLAQRTQSFKEFVEEWVLDQFVESLGQYGLSKPWYWDTFISALDHYHHMVYAGAYTYRASVWFDFVLPGPRERAWLAEKYPASWPQFDPIWARLAAAWGNTTAGNDFAVHGTAIIGFCDLCQLVLAGGTPQKNTAVVLEHAGKKRIFCSEPCKQLFLKDTACYGAHQDVVKRVLSGIAPANLIALVRNYFGLSHETWGKDAFAGEYPFVHRRGTRPR